MDTLQARIVQLEQENAALRALLKKHGIAYPETAENQISAIANQGSRMLQNEVTPQMVSFFYTYFRGRKDVYSVRSRPKDGKAGYFPVCTHFWDHKFCPKTTGQKIACRDCPNRAYKPLNIFVYADKESKIERCQRRAPAGENMTTSEIEKRMKQIDRNRSQHHQMYSDSKWGAKESYDLCVNTTRRYVKDLVPAIAKFCEDWFNSHE